MPANLTPDYKAAEAKYRAAKNNEDKLNGLIEMLRTIPKHKGTEHLQGDIKRKISQLKKESKKKSATAHKTAFFLVEKEGTGQVFLVGTANTGKSQLLQSLTKAQSEVAPYPYTTRKPVPGMLKYDNIQIQLVDTPAIDRDFMETWLPGIIRNGHLVLLLADLCNQDPLEQIEIVMERLQTSKLRFVKGKKAELQDQGIMQLPLILVGTKLDGNGAPENAKIIRELYTESFEFIPVSAIENEGLENLKEMIYRNLHIIRVYTKSPGKKPDYTDPVILDTGETVMDFARQLHKDFANQLKYAKIWGREMYDGQKVQRDFVLREGDVLELHI